MNIQYVGCNLISHNGRKMVDKGLTGRIQELCGFFSCILPVAAYPNIVLKGDILKAAAVGGHLTRGSALLYLLNFYAVLSRAKA